MNRPRCLDRCNSPIACQGWGYCRDRNKNGVPKSEKVIRAWQEMDWPEQFTKTDANNAQNYVGDQNGR